MNTTNIIPKTFVGSLKQPARHDNQVKLWLEKNRKVIKLVSIKQGINETSIITNIWYKEIS